MGIASEPGGPAPPLAEPAAALLAGVVAGEPASLARAISAVENGAPFAAALACAAAARAGRAHVVGITGAPGAGKSTLISALLGEILARDQRVAVVAVDPSSPRTGGAVLGDRIRMGEFGADPRVFIRSLAARGHLGGLSRTTAAVVDLLDAAGFDTVIVETVGAGQSEVEVSTLADTSVVVCPPGLGDDVQASKAGILEVADVFVVSKGDLPAAERTVRELKDMLALRARGPGWAPPVLLVTAPARAGIGLLVDALRDHAAVGGRGRRLRPGWGQAEPDSATARAPDVATAEVPDVATAEVPDVAAARAPEAVAAHERVARLAARDAFVRHTGIDFVAGGLGTATLRLPVGPQHINFNGTCHGGALFALADSAFGLACNSQGIVTAAIDCHVTFQVAVRVGDVLEACAVEASRSNRVCVYRVEVVRKRDRALVSTFTGTAYITGKPHGSPLAPSGPAPARGGPAAGDADR